MLALVVFFPLVGWGFFGLSVGPKLIGASLVPHVLFAGVLWMLCLWAFHEPTGGHGAPSHGFG